MSIPHLNSYSSMLTLNIFTYRY